MAFSEANLKPFVRVCSSLPGEPHARTQLSGGSGPIAGGSSAMRKLVRDGALGDVARYSEWIVGYLEVIPFTATRTALRLGLFVFHAAFCRRI
jgi:hypothetical protein